MKRKSNFKVRIIKGGPYEVTGRIPINDAIIKATNKQESETWEINNGDYDCDKEKYFLCRCGHSAKKPFCDGAHVKQGFEGAEVASKEKYHEKARHYKGKKVDLLDQRNLCIHARFCNVLSNVWNLVRYSDEDENIKVAIEQSNACPAGRLTVLDKEGNCIEPDLPQEISLIDDEINYTNGPLWLKGCIEVEGCDGEEYELRNRVTLCRCGESKNMPFCDGAHYDCQHMINKSK